MRLKVTSTFLFSSNSKQNNHKNIRSLSLSLTLSLSLLYVCKLLLSLPLFHVNSASHVIILAIYSWANLIGLRINYIISITGKSHRQWDHMWLGLACLKTQMHCQTHLCIPSSFARWIARHFSLSLFPSSLPLCIATTGSVKTYSVSNSRCNLLLFSFSFSPFLLSTWLTPLMYRKYLRVLMRTKHTHTHTLTHTHTHACSLSDSVCVTTSFFHL